MREFQDPPDDLTFPFRPDGNGGVLQFSWRRFQWEPLVGTGDNLGYRIASWTPRNARKEALCRRFDKVHRVVWVAHNGPIPEGLEIDHVDGVKDNNHVGNLRLVTHSQNLRYARALNGNWSPRKLKPHQVALTLAMPSNADWRFWSNRWGVHKVTLLTIRCQAKKKASLFS